VVEVVERVLNPLIVKGQLHGGVAQGLGQELMEEVSTRITASRLRLVPRLLHAASTNAGDPDRRKRGSTSSNPLASRVPANPALSGPCRLDERINDALAPLGVTQFDMPATPERIWRAIQEASEARGAGRGSRHAEG
jgi:carbon-monoxide dehydrogenase large subunit